jgi:hypothetical protein
VSHPSLGLPPRDLLAGHPEAAALLLRERSHLAGRALEVALERDPSLRQRYDPVGLRRLLRDLSVLLERVARSVAGNDPSWVRAWADQAAPIYRKRRVPMDDLVTLAEALRVTVAARLDPGAREAAYRALDEAVQTFRWYRRIAGDARRRNRLLTFLYKGA